jgi:hypothetical protein
MKTTNLLALLRPLSPFLFLKKIASFFKKICNSKNLRTFALSNGLKGGSTRLKQAGFFYIPQLNINGITPAGNCNRTPALEVFDNGSVTPFFCYHKQNISEMSNTEKIASKAKHSNLASTSDHESVFLRHLSLLSPLLSPKSHLQEKGGAK